MPRTPIIAVVGSGREIEPAISNAHDLGTLIARNGWRLVTGGRSSGVMRSANEGAKSAGGLTIGILPYVASDVSDAVDVAIFTDTGQARNNIIVLTADVVIACGVDGAGTASEVSLAVKNRKPVIILVANATAKRFFQDIGGNDIQFADSPTDAIVIAADLVANGSQKA